MAWTYSSAPSTGTSQGRRDAVRWLINDRFTTRQLVQDAIVSFALAQWGNNLYYAAAACADALADSEAVSAKVGDFSLGGEKPRNYRDLATKLRFQAALRGVTPIWVANSSAAKNTIASDRDRVIPAFTRAMQANKSLPSGTTSSTRGN